MSRLLDLFPALLEEALQNPAALLLQDSSGYLKAVVERSDSRKV
jgi:hypothetical protein